MSQAGKEGSAASSEFATSATVRRQKWTSVYQGHLDQRDNVATRSTSALVLNQASCKSRFDHAKFAWSCDPVCGYIPSKSGLHLTAHYYSYIKERVVREIASIDLVRSKKPSWNQYPQLENPSELQVLTSSKSWVSEMVSLRRNFALKRCLASTNFLSHSLCQDRSISTFVEASMFLFNILSGSTMKLLRKVRMPSVLLSRSPNVSTGTQGCGVVKVWLKTRVASASLCQF